MKILRKSNHIRQDGFPMPSEWVSVEDICNVVNGPGNYLYKVDGVEYRSRSAEWQRKLQELQIWSKLQNV